MSAALVEQRAQPRLTRALLLWVGVLCASTGLALVHLRVGDYQLAVEQLLQVLRGNGTAEQTFIVLTLRLPRVVLALLVGMCLGFVGGTLQAVLRNPLADAGVLGVSAGASLWVVALATIGGSSLQAWQSLAAFAGGCCALAVVLLFVGRSTEPLRYLLAGVGVSAVAQGGTLVLTTYGQIWDVQAALVWMSGSMALARWHDVQVLAAWMTVGFPVIVLCRREIQLLALGDPVARGLGVPVATLRVVVLVAAVALASATVAVAGVVGLVGLLAPVAARRLLAADFQVAAPLAAGIGAALVIGADLLGRVIVPMREIPAGLMTTIIGAPLLLWLLWRHAKGTV